MSADDADTGKISGNLLGRLLGDAGLSAEEIYRPSTGGKTLEQSRHKAYARHSAGKFSSEKLGSVDDPDTVDGHETGTVDDLHKLGIGAGGHDDLWIRRHDA